LRELSPFYAAAKRAAQAEGRPGAPADVPESLGGFIHRRSAILRLNAGGPCESLLNKYGQPVDLPASATLAESILRLLNESPYTLRPNPFLTKIVPPGAGSQPQADGPVARRRVLRWAILAVAMALPCIGLTLLRDRLDRSSESMLAAMRTGYERRFGGAVPDPLLALKAKSKTSAAAGRPPAVPIHTWLSVLSRISDQAFASALRLDVVSLDGVRVDIQGSAADMQAVTQWVSGLTSDPILTDATLISSQPRMSDRRTAFLVRARIRLPSRDR